jgi:hypothetical protein
MTSQNLASLGDPHSRFDVERMDAMRGPDFDPFAVLCELILQNEEHFTKFMESFP